MNCQISVTVQSDSNDVLFNCYLLLAERKILIYGNEIDNARFSFDETGNGHVPLHLNDQALVLVVGVSEDKKVYFGTKSFTVAQKQNVTVNITGPVSKQEFHQFLKSQKLYGVRLSTSR